MHSTQFIYGPETPRLGMGGNALINDTLNTFCLRLYCIIEDSGMNEMFYLTTHSTHFIYGPETSRLGEGRKYFI